MAMKTGIAGIDKLPGGIFNLVLINIPLLVPMCIDYAETNGSRQGTGLRFGEQWGKGRTCMYNCIRLYWEVWDPLGFAISCQQNRLLSLLGIHHFQWSSVCFWMDFHRCPQIYIVKWLATSTRLIFRIQITRSQFLEPTTHHPVWSWIQAPYTTDVVGGFSTIKNWNNQKFQTSNQRQVCYTITKDCWTGSENTVDVFWMFVTTLCQDVESKWNIRLWNQFNKAVWTALWVLPYVGHGVSSDTLYCSVETQVKCHIGKVLAQ